MWSNIHDGYQAAEVAWRLDQPYIDCPSYNGACFSISEESELFGKDNPLDYMYSAAGAAFSRSGAGRIFAAVPRVLVRG